MTFLAAFVGTLTAAFVVGAWAWVFRFHLRDYWRVDIADRERQERIAFVVAWEPRVAALEAKLDKVQLKIDKLLARALR